MSEEKSKLPEQNALALNKLQREISSVKKEVRKIEEHENVADIPDVQESLAHLSTRNTEMPGDKDRFAAEELFIEQLKVMSQVTSMFCQNQYDKTKFNQARELYLMNAVGVSYQNFERTKFKKLSE